MDKIDVLLQKIYEGKYLGKRKLDSFLAFLNGYTTRYEMVLWEKETGTDFFEHFDLSEYHKLKKLEGCRGSLYKNVLEFMEFNYVVHYHYNLLHSHTNNGEVGPPQPWTNTDPIGLIYRKCSTEEEAFEVFFKLWFEYKERKEILGGGLKFIEYYEDLARARAKARRDGTPE